MAESAYHNEALRRQRAIERKKEAERRLLDGNQTNATLANGDANNFDPVLYSGPGHYEQNRSSYSWLGTARERKQYNHSRQGPVMAQSWLGLKRELRDIGQGMPMFGRGHPVTFSQLQQIRYVTPRP